jgi:hypothetical protein
LDSAPAAFRDANAQAFDKGFDNGQLPPQSTPVVESGEDYLRGLETLIVGSHLRT